MYNWTCMALALNLQSKIIFLHLDGMSAYGISNELKIHYRTAKKYTDALDHVIDEIKEGIAYCIFEEIKKNPQNFTENIMQVYCNNEVKHA